MTDPWPEQRERARKICAAPLEPDRRRELAALAVGLLDLTSLNATDREEDVRRLCARAREHGVAAACVHSSFAEACARELRGSLVRACVVGGAFPHGQAPLAAKLAEVDAALEAGAQEIDIVINRGLLLEGRLGEMAGEIGAIRAPMRGRGPRATLKVILETCEIPTPALLREASDAVIAELEDGDFLKTSTGKGAGGATPEGAVVMLEGIAGAAATGRRIGFKAAGGIRTSDDAISYLRLAEAICGAEWLARERLRLGASTLLDELLKN
jgi:deoxyribose-phosphate aldolase